MKDDPDLKTLEANAAAAARAYDDARAKGRGVARARKAWDAAVAKVDRAAGVQAAPLAPKPAPAESRQARFEARNVDAGFCAMSRTHGKRVDDTRHCAACLARRNGGKAAKRAARAAPTVAT